ncbi:MULTISPECIES: HNH endonuclease signature motif containing protein [unclassified Brevibacterium]|uniref:HNH endonuclease signature motif containing protein n=1 Tax=unclassified Brevibacterium TaxID=2614124 RepID=UPI001E5F0F74|nr:MULTISPECIES: HNH endonuclease signature motif containing protein [unclassified Brevibacterium]MCD1287303.1 hypothetical protein [Brevibacterium sp. CCUG 69071]MDK8436441.1 HNH endonuclease signature motif containing protein [Brevibacterium sp. H-BE7]
MARNRRFSRTGADSTDNWNRGVIPQRVMDRAHEKIVRSMNGCWISTYSTASHGYAQVGWQSKADGRGMVLAHRAVWEKFNGPVPIGMTLDHLCREKRCVNPAHLRLLENFENGRRTHGANWKLGECANGHPNSMLAEDPHRKDKAGNLRSGKRCAGCRKLHQARNNWRTRHPGEPIPEVLLLASERRELGAAA